MINMKKSSAAILVCTLLMCCALAAAQTTGTARVTFYDEADQRGMLAVA